MMNRFLNACNLRFSICSGEWKNDSVEANEYTIGLSIGTRKWNICELIIEFKYMGVCNNYLGLSLESLRNEFQYNLLVYRQNYINLILSKKILLDVEKERSALAITLMLLFNVTLLCEPADQSMELRAYLWCHLPFRGISPKEGEMMKQMSFKLNEHEELQTVWNRIPESNQKEVIRLYAKLIAQTAKSEICAEAKEEGGGDVE
jgi:hypothetical protein